MILEKEDDGNKQITEQVARHRHYIVVQQQ